MELVFLIPIAALAAATFIVKWSLEYSKWKHMQTKGDSSAENSLRMSELTEMIQEAVEEANAPLRQRLDALDERMDTLGESRVLSARQPSLLDDAFEADQEGVPVSRKQRVS